MNNKTTSIVLLVVTVASLGFAIYTNSKASNLSDEIMVLKNKYEEAIVDAEDSGQRLEKMRADLEKALKESEEHRLKAEAALLELQKHKSGK